MSTTIRLPDDLKARVARAPQRSGTTPHSFILEAIAEKVDREDGHDDIDDAAERRYAEIAASGKAIPWSEMRRYLEDRLTDKTAMRPSVRKLAR